jgi:hypothetical protein
MPARSNDFQAVVYFVQRHLAPDATVTESAQLRDRVTGQNREVDVLITADLAGQSTHISIECRKRSRKDHVSWVEEMRAKHDDLSTDQLVLVSATGFSKAAAVKARHYGIETFTPGQPVADDGPLARLRHPSVETRDLTIKDLIALRGTFEVDGQSHTTTLTMNHVMFAADGAQLGLLADLVTSTMNGLDRRPIVAAARDGDQVINITVTDPRFRLDEAGPVTVYLRRDDVGDVPVQLMLLLEIQIICVIGVDVRSVDLSAGELQGAAYAYGCGRVGGVDALLVFTHTGDGGHLAVRLTDADGAVTDWSADPSSQELLPHGPPRTRSPDNRPTPAPSG